MSIVVVKPGMLTTIQAGPRQGLRHLGVPASGAADPLSLALANKLVGNRALAAALEVTFVGPRLRFECCTQFALTGASANAELNGSTVAFHKTQDADVGDELILHPAEVGARVYIAFAGGLVADEVLGSVSTYVPAGFGGFAGRPLQDNDRLRLGEAAGPVELETPQNFRPPITTRWALRACGSAETGLLAEGQRGVLFDTHWKIGLRADRMGVAMAGRRLKVNSDGRMASAPVFPGTIQCPENGEPFLLGVDAQTTGGYPRIAQIARADRHLLGQMRANDSLLLLPRHPDEAVNELRAKHDVWRQWLPDIERVI